MEGRPGNAESPETQLIKKFGLQPGTHAAFEKIALHTQSSVPVGSVVEGEIQSEIKIGEPILLDNGARISDVKKIEEQHGELLIHTSTSIYRLRVEAPSYRLRVEAPSYRLRVEAPSEKSEKINYDDIETVETAKGSRYRYLPDGTTQRFKKVEGRDYDPQAALVYIPDWNWVKKNAPPDVLKKLGDNEDAYTQILLHYVHDGNRVYIVDKEGKKMNTNQEIRESDGQTYLVFLSNGKTDFSIPVSHTPRIGWMTFDTRTYDDEKTGEHMRERHLGNAVTEITLKNEKKNIEKDR